jgi:hypothetical protein
MIPAAPLDELYAAPLAEFVATRDRLAATAAREGHKDEAQALKKLRRPSATAWATNQVVREARAAVEEMLSASDRLRRSQDALLAGRSDQAAYQAGVDELRAATAALGAAARDVLERAGRGAREHVDGVIANVRVAALSDERRAELLEARLTADLESGDQGLAGFLGASVAGGPHLRLVPPAPKVSAPAPSAEAARREKEEREAHARRVADARAEAATAREVVARAEAAAQKARAARATAASRLAEAEREVATARDGDATAQAALAEAERHLAAVSAEAHAAARRLDALGERR